MKFQILALSFFMMISNTYSMTYAIEEPDGKPNYCRWIISGDISKDEFSFAEEMFKKYINKCKQNTSSYIDLSISLNSNGGDVDAAIAIGRMLRRYGVKTYVRPDSQCLSSCVFIFMAGLERVSTRQNLIGIHRPFFADLNSQISLNEIQNIRRKRIEIIKNYMNEMDIPLSLLDLMLTIPPSEIKLLTYEDMETYRLNQDDPAWDEKRTSILASRYGLTSSEYRRLDAIADDVCKKSIKTSKRTESQTLDDSYCREAILFKVDKEKIKRKFPMIEAKCMANEVDDTEKLFSCMRIILKQP